MGGRVTSPGLPDIGPVILLCPTGLVRLCSGTIPHLYVTFDNFFTFARFCDVPTFLTPEINYQEQLST